MELQQISEPIVLRRDASTFGMLSTSLLLPYVFLKLQVDDTSACFLINWYVIC